MKTPSPSTSPNVDNEINEHEHYSYPSMTAVDNENKCKTKLIHIVLNLYKFL
jgi:hypothetical protein